MNVIKSHKVINVTSVPMHKHNFWEMVIYTSGSCHTRIGDKSFFVKKGSVAIIPPDMPHNEIADEAYSDLCVTANYMPFFDTEPFVVEDYTSNIYLLGKMIFTTLIERNNNFESIADTLLSSIFEYITQLSADSKIPPLVRDIEHFLTENLSNPQADMDLICEKFGYNRDYLRRFFKKYTNITPLEHLNNLRISHAKQLLSSDIYHVSEISAMCGFTDAYYFSRMFKKSTGLSPYHFRKKY